MMTMQQIKELSDARGSYFFSPDTMEFWGTKLTRKVWQLGPDVYMFITCEGNHPDYDGVWVLRMVDFSDGEVHFSTLFVAGGYNEAHDAGDKYEIDSWN